ncbi:hypothetical protein JL720_16814 [Aureococcus anophagefferens]|nr:hypothetical protein JL720_16814 [Aureococcus anophagefferens]
MSDPWVEQINLAQAKRDEGDLPAAKALQRDLAAAEPLFRRALAIGEKQHGLRVALDIENLAAVLWARGEHAEAELLFQRAIAIHKDPEYVARLEKQLATSQEERDAELKRNAIAVDESDAEEGARPTRASALEDQLKELRVKGVEFDIAAALYWCKKNGADELSEIVEADMVDDFVASLSLTGKPLLPVKAGLLKKRLAAVAGG